MFYSPTILAKKSPLGTVWMAAHLERKTKKAQIEKINIAFYADKLIYPDVPIALRLSAHLMLGLVRIYAWKVDYTFTDSNRLLTDLRTAIVNIKINLPSDANRAPPKSVTLPSSFDLDGIDLDDLREDTEGFNGHQKTYEQITITDYGEENYVRFVIDENISSSPSSHHSMRSAEPIDDMLPPCSDHMQELITKDKNAEDVSAPANLDEVESQFHDTFVDNQFDHAPDGNQNNPNANQSDEFNDILRETQFNIPSENQSDAVPNENLFHDNIGKNLHHDSPIEQLRSVHPSPSLFKDSGARATGHFSASPNNDINAAPESPSPVPFQLDASPEEIAQVNQNVFQPSPQREGDVPFSPQNAMQQDEVEIAIAPSPPPVREKRKRKKIQYYFDRHIVLSNKAIKEQLKDQAVNLLVRKRKKLPSAPLDAWGNQCAHLKDQMFDQPLISWEFATQQEKRTYPAIINEEPEMHPFTGPTEQSPNHGITIEEPIHSPVGGPIPQSPRDVTETVEEEPPLKSPNHGVPIEEPFIDPPMGPPCHSPNNDISFTINPPASPLQPFPMYANEPPERLRCQPAGENVRVPSPLMDLGWNTPTSSNNIHNSPSSSLPAFEPEVLLNSRRSPPAKRPWPMSESPLTPSHERDNFRTPILRRSAEIEDLNFLETPPSVKAKRARTEDGASPTVLFGNDSEKKAGWSARSMGMVKYLREHLRGAPNAEEQNGNISLDHILEGKTRKYCARMFFETLVLKTEDYIDVKQEKPYGDVLIMPKTKLTAHN